METVAVITHDKKKNDSQHTKYGQNFSTSPVKIVISVAPYRIKFLSYAAVLVQFPKAFPNR